VFSWYDVILAKSKQIIGVQFQTLFFRSFLLVLCSSIFRQIWFY